MMRNMASHAALQIADTSSSSLRGAVDGLLAAAAPAVDCGDRHNTRVLCDSLRRWAQLVSRSPCLASTSGSLVCHTLQVARLKTVQVVQACAACKSGTVFKACHCQCVRSFLSVPH